MACRWQEEGPVMRNAFVIFHPGRKLISCDFSETLPAGAGGAARRLRDRNRQGSQLMWRWTLSPVLMRSAAERIGLKEVGRGRARVEKVWRWSELQCGTPVFVTSKNVLCRHLMSLLESDEEVPSACFERMWQLSTIDSIFDAHSQNLRFCMLAEKRFYKLYHYSEGVI